MKAITILLFSCATALAADDDVRVLSCSQHLDWGATNIVEYYSRGIETNLIRTTLVAPHEPLCRVHQFFHRGQFLGYYVTGTNNSGCITAPSADYMLALSYGPSNDLRAVIIGNKEGQVIDAFGCTNGFISPVGRSMLRQAKFIDMRKFVQPDGLRRQIWGEP